MPSLFTKIIRGEIPCHKLLEDENYFAFLEIRPLKPGHTLVIPKQETDYFFDLDEKTMTGLMLFSKKVAQAIQKTTGSEKVAVVVYGLLIRHAHVHLIPVDGAPGELDFSKQRDAKTEELTLMAQKITGNLSRPPK